MSPAVESRVPVQVHKDMKIKKQGGRLKEERDLNTIPKEFEIYLTYYNS